MQTVPRLGRFVFLLSGAASLLYQVLWQRLLVIFSGADVYSVTVIVAAFMAGLGLGSLGGGRLADRLGPKRSLWAFVGAELAIGAFGALSRVLYYDILTGRLSHLAADPVAAAAVLFASLLVPTCLMGLSLPLLARGLVRAIDDTGPVVGSLYGWNTVGAATGALAGTWVLLPAIGIAQALIVAVVLNVTCAALAPWLVLSRPRAADMRAAPRSRRPPADVAASGGGVPYAGWVALCAIAGFVALGLEIVWFRLLGVMLKSGAFTFGTLLAVYLSGLGLGSALGARYVGRSRQAGQTYLGLQYAATLYAAGSVLALVALVAAGRPIKLVRYFGEYDPVDIAATLAAAWPAGASDLVALRLLLEFAVLYAVVPLVMIGPPTLLMGLGVPYLQKASHTDFERLGQRLGLLLSGNIAGSMAGAMVTGWLLMPMLGSAGTLKVLVGVGGLLALPLAWLRWQTATARCAGAVALTAVPLATIVALPDGEQLWARLHAAQPRHVLHAEDASGLAVLKADRGLLDGPIGVYVNGLGQSWIPYGNVHTALGVLPVLIHPQARRVAIIGLGSGDTAFAAAGGPAVDQVTCIEIIGAQLETLRTLTRIRPDAGVQTLLTSTRITHAVGDGRTYIRQAGEDFDVIEADALRPTSAYAGNLYSREYFDLLRRHLAPGGYAVTWAPTERTRRTFASVFPYVLGVGDILMGSDGPIRFSREDVEARATAQRAYFERAGVDIEAVLRPYLDAEPFTLGPADARSMDDLNTDLFPRDEFALRR